MVRGWRKSRAKQLKSGAQGLTGSPRENYRNYFETRRWKLLYKLIKWKFHEASCAFFLCRTALRAAQLLHSTCSMRRRHAHGAFIPFSLTKINTDAGSDRIELLNAELMRRCNYESHLKDGKRMIHTMFGCAHVKQTLMDICCVLYGKSWRAVLKQLK